jgi:hypothetical protein
MSRNVIFVLMYHRQKRIDPIINGITKHKKLFMCPGLIEAQYQHLPGGPEKNLSG